MPTRLLPVEHCTQEHEAGCLAACGQMVLRFMGIEQSQHRLNQLLGLTSIGAPYTNITRLAQLDVRITIATGDQLRLQQSIEQNLPTIAFLFTGELPYWQENTPHAVVVVGFDETNCFVNDPAFHDAPQVVPWGDFWLAWGEMDYTYAEVLPQ